MNELALFAGAGGGILAGKLLGWRAVCAVERNPYRRGVLLRRQNEQAIPAFPVWDDVCTFDGRPWRGIVDVISGGFPCQAYSSAASGKNNADDLWPEMRRIVADVAPRNVFAENVSRRAIDAAADDLEQMGYKTRAISLSASDLGGDHIRERFWLRAYTDSDGELCSPINAEAPSLQEFRSGVWQAKLEEPRISDELAAGMERLRATGDGQIPLVAATAWRLLGGP